MGGGYNCGISLNNHYIKKTHNIILKKECNFVFHYLFVLKIKKTRFTK